jgi:hypothetical protein
MIKVQQQPHTMVHLAVYAAAPHLWMQATATADSAPIGRGCSRRLFLLRMLSAARSRLVLQLQVWKATVYLTPLMGGYLADAGEGSCHWLGWASQCCYDRGDVVAGGVPETTVRRLPG